MNRRRTRTSPTASRRAFTLLEVMLAAALGIIVVFSVMAFFTTMDRAKRHQAFRMEVNAEMATAHHVIQHALRSLVMQSGGEGKDDELKEHIEKDIRDAQGPGADIRDENIASMRFALQPDSTQRGTGHVMQTLELVLTTPPIHAITLSDDTRQQEELSLRQLERMRERQLNLFAKKSGPGASSSSRSSAGGLGAKGDSRTSSRESNPGAAASRSSASKSSGSGDSLLKTVDDPLARNSPDMEAPRAPGVRGVFELRPETDPAVLARAGGNGAGVAWSLWWRQIPPDDDLVPETNQNAGVRDQELLALARASRTDGPEVKLLAGLSDASWQVYRRRNFVPKMSAMKAQELPAYVEFKFETIDGRREDWMFEVSWSYGAEPGTVLAVNDPLANPAGAGDPQLALLNQLGLLGPDGKPINPANNPNNPNNPGNPNTGGTRSTTQNPNGSNGGNGSGSGNGGFGSGNTGGGSITTSGGMITITLPNGQSITIPNPRR